MRDEKTVKGAQAFVRKTTNVLYDKNPATVSVHGVSAHYGTDGGQIATVTYTRGRYVFEVLLTTQMGPATGTQAAAAFGDAPVK